MTIFSDNLTRLRKSRNLTQSAVAAAINVSTSGYSLYEQGRRAPDLDKLAHLARLFSCTTDKLLGVEIAAEDTSTARLAEAGIQLDYKDGLATLRREGAAPIELGKVSKTDLAAEIKKALADYDKDTREQKNNYIVAKLQEAASKRAARLAINNATLFPDFFTGVPAPDFKPLSKGEIQDLIDEALKHAILTLAKKDEGQP